VDDRNDNNGSYVYGIDTTYDSNDEIVFMPRDGGQQVDTTNWGPAGVDTDMRYEIAVTDPLTSGTVYAYVFKSSTLTYTAGSYITYDDSTKTVTTDYYTVDFGDNNAFLMDLLSVSASNGGDNTNLIDRLKFRAEIDGTDVSEENLQNQSFAPTYRYKAGPVRLIMFDRSYFYLGMAEMIADFTWDHDTSYIRFSMDMNSNAGDMKYYNSNGDTLNIDGSPDAPASNAMPSWMQVSGAHGSLITIWDINMNADSTTLYYRDDQSHMDNPESDAGEWGDYGIYGDTLARPQNIHTDLILYPLPALSTNMGNTYQSYKDNPLQVASELQNNSVAH